MPTGMRSEADDAVEPSAGERPELSVCEGAPGTTVFTESGNSDGWIAIDGAVEVTR
ncbi:hypothetical protein SAMN05192561_1247 [Halopenitus malekzadehii]|uniref:Uncharacterized protein n=1 Tax=Halopenitus malekzadehii TaxID=1267564 RepID=A0A1H6K011_9EURY|nr:hypothetical protein [Halopenitus malekzadehii]SEH66240.1 hypothetical protein SAMN05192561_1247 [Halopenitus malekzadehii]